MLSIVVVHRCQVTDCVKKLQNGKLFSLCIFLILLGDRMNVKVWNHL